MLLIILFFGLRLFIPNGPVLKKFLHRYFNAQHDTTWNRAKYSNKGGYPWTNRIISMLITIVVIHKLRNSLFVYFQLKTQSNVCVQHWITSWILLFLLCRCYVCTFQGFKLSPIVNRKKITIAFLEEHPRLIWVWI